MLPGIAEFILNAETNFARFEKFAAAICGRSEDVTFVPTSQTYDRGRDGRSMGRSRGTHANVICATLNTELDDKVARRRHRRSRREFRRWNAVTPACGESWGGGAAGNDRDRHPSRSRHPSFNLSSRRKVSSNDSAKRLT